MTHKRAADSTRNAVICAVAGVVLWGLYSWFASSPAQGPVQEPARAVEPRPIVGAVVEPRPADDEAAIAAAIADFTARGWVYDYRVNPATRTLRLAVPPGAVPEGYGDEAVRRICGRLWFHGVNTIGGERPIVRLVGQINDLSPIATGECP